MNALPGLADRYQVEREIGAGGMATVYLAHDLRHDRKVAIKVLHPDLAAVIGADRFLSEIKLTASLQHPHILSLFDSGVAEGRLYYVMPFVEGETLRARLEREKQLPVADAVRIACDIAEALSYAHGRGIVHRDIKPENVLLHEGRPQLADFGIALAVQQAGGNRLTQTGLSLGTPHYMSPEQAMGERTIDARADIYALGAMTYEMLTGAPPFTGANAPAVVARLLTGTPTPVREVRRNVPDHVEATVQDALEKLPADRPSSATEYAQRLRGELLTHRPIRSSRFQRAWLVSAALVVLLVTVAGYAVWQPKPVAPAIMAALIPPPGELWPSTGSATAFSPRGDRVALVSARPGEESRLVIRTLASDILTDVPGSGDGRYPFFSPDGESLGFFADNALKVVNLANGSVQTLCPAPRPYGASWGSRGVIVYAPDRTGELHRTTIAGRECEAMPMARPAGTSVPRPFFMADGRHFIASDDRFTYIGDLDGDALVILRENQLSVTHLAAPDYILFRDGEFTYAQRVDVRRKRLVGEPQRLMDRLSSGGGNTALAVSAAGHLLARFAGSGDGRDRIGIYDRSNRALDSLTFTGGGNWWSMSAARHGGTIALGGWGAWLLDVERGVAERILPDTVRRAFNSSAWSPGDTLIAFARTFTSAEILVYDPRTGIGRVIKDLRAGGRSFAIADWSPDGRMLALQLDPGNGALHAEPWALDVATGELRIMFEEGADVGSVRYSPDGAWLAYRSTLTDRSQVYIRPTAGGPARLISTDGGTIVRWRGDRELLYHARDGAIMSVALDADMRPAPPREVVPVAVGSRLPDWEVSADGNRVLGRLTGGFQTPGYVLVLNWLSLLSTDERARR